MSKKAQVVAGLGAKVDTRWSLPKTPKKDATLLEQGAVLVLMRHMTQAQAEQSVTALTVAFDDWNEARVSQVQELAQHLRTSSRKQGTAQRVDNTQAATSLKVYLQEVFQKTHGLDIEEWREDLTSATKLMVQMPFLGLAAGSYLLWLAAGERLVAHPGLLRVFDRMGLIRRTSSMKKGRDMLEAMIPPGGTIPFLGAFNEVADRWCDARKPLCHACTLKDDCKYGKKAYKDWQAQQVRLEAQREKDELRRIAQEKKDAARVIREEARAAKKADAEKKRKKRELERVRKIEAQRRSAEAKKKAAKKAATKKKVTKKVTKKKVTKKATPARGKAASSARSATAKKKAAKKVTKKPAVKKTTAKKKTAKKAAAKKTTTKKAAAKKAPAKKTAKKASKRR